MHPDFVKFRHPLSFHGRGGDLFSIFILNVLLTVCTLGLYWPWARANMLRFVYGHTELDGSRFEFTGTGREMFKGFIKALFLIVLLYGSYFLAILSGDPILIVLGALFFLIGLISIIPLAVHGTMRYRLAKTRWRGIQFGYRGSLKALYKIWMKGILLTIITFGFYFPWLEMDMRQYVFAHSRFGNVSFKFKGTGGEYFSLNILGYLTTVITLGIYSFWWIRNRIRFFVDNTSLETEGFDADLRSNITAGNVLEMALVSFFGVVLTLGLGTPWVICFNLGKVINSIEIEGDLDWETILQTEADYKDATGDDLADILDLNLI